MNVHHQVLTGAIAVQARDHGRLLRLMNGEPCPDARILKFGDSPPNAFGYLSGFLLLLFLFVNHWIEIGVRPFISRSAD